MRTRSLIVAALCGVTILGWTIGHGSGPAVAARECPADVGAADHAIGVDAVYQGGLVGTAPRAPTRGSPRAWSHGRWRRARGRTAYVEDRRGADAIVVSTPHGTRVLPQTGEAYHPTWSDHGAVAWGVDDELVVRSASGERTIAGPQPGGIVFAPVFVGRAIVAAVSAAPTTAVPEDAWSDDLWLLRGGRWHRLTAFAAGTDRWTAIRTPFLAADGSRGVRRRPRSRIAGRAAAVLAVATARCARCIASCRSTVSATWPATRPTAPGCGTCRTVPRKRG